MSKFQIGDKVVAIPERANKLSIEYRGMTLTVKKIDSGGIFCVEEHGWSHLEKNWMKVTPEPKYEIGKKYTKTHPGCKPSIYTCVDLTLTGIPVMTKGSPNTKVLYEGEVLKEYIEPKVHTWYVHWFKSPGTVPYCYTSVDKTPPYGSDYIRTDVVTYTEK